MVERCRSTDVQNFQQSCLIYEGQFCYGIPQGRAVITFSDSSKYEGNIFSCNFEGYGKLQIKDGTYDGYWQRSEFHGYGVLKHRQSICKGIFNNGSNISCWILQTQKQIFVGSIELGTSVSIGKQLYIGQVHKFHAHGYGIQLHLKGSYEGSFVNGKRQGKGTLVLDDFILYIGSWVENIFDGQGVLICANYHTTQKKFQNRQMINLEIYESEFVKHSIKGTFNKEILFRYEGDWIRGKMHGQGILQTESYKYVGAFVNGRREGNCTIKYSDISTFKGTYYSSRVSKQPTSAHQGTYRLQNGFEFQGSWQNGYLYGMGEWLFNDVICIGEFFQSKMNGKGQITFANDDFYCGEIKNNEMIGYGLHITKNLTIIHCFVLYQYWQHIRTQTNQILLKKGRYNLELLVNSYEQFSFLILLKMNSMEQKEISAHGLSIQIYE